MRVCACIQCLYYQLLSRILFLIIFFFFLIALRESPIKRRSRLSKMIAGSEPDKDMISTPITIRNDRGGLHSSPIGRRSYDTTPLPSYQSDTRY
jgi:hypothetical protein